MSDENFLSRWSRRKHESKQAPEQVAPEEVPSAIAQPSATVPQVPAQPALPEAAPLPPVESLTPDSDFTPFMQPKVDADLKRQALKKLFADPRFNVMDGLDVYIDDYTKTTPIPEGWLEKMEQIRHLGVFKKQEEAEADPEEKSPEKAPPAIEEKAATDQPVAVAPSDTSSKEISD